MRPFIVGPREKAALRKLKRYAFDHPLTMEAMKAAMSSQAAHRYGPGNYVTLPIGFEVGLTYELQEKPVWHLSMCLDAPNRVPHPMAVSMVLRELGLPALQEAAAHEMINQVINVWFVDEKTQKTVAE